MAKTCANICGLVTYVVSALGILALTVFLGVALIVPQYPFHKRDIASGVCLIIFATLIGIIGGVIFGAFGFCCGLVCESAVDSCCGDDNC